MITIFINSKNNKTSDTHRLLLNLTGKINIKRSAKYVVLSNRIYTIREKTIRTIHIRTANLKYQLNHGMKNLSYLIDHILYKILKIILAIY